MEDGNHNQIVNDLILAKENQNPIELNRLLEQLRSISDRERLLEISQILHQLALERGIDFDYINIGNNTITIANEGVLSRLVGLIEVFTSYRSFRYFWLYWVCYL